MIKRAKVNENADAISQETTCYTVLASIIHFAAALVSFEAAYEAINDPKIIKAGVQTSFLAIALFVSMIGSYFMVMTVILFFIHTWNSNPELIHTLGIAFYFMSVLFFIGALGWAFLYFLIFESAIVTNLLLERVPIFCIAFAVLFAAIAGSYTCIGRGFREDSRENFIQFQLRTVN